MTDEPDPDDIFSEAYIAKRKHRYESGDEILAALQNENEEKRAKRWKKNTRKRTKEGPEAKIKEKCREYLEDTLRAEVLRTNAGQITDEQGRTIYLGKTGQADLHALVPIRLSDQIVIGAFFAIETKAPGNKPTPAQEKYLAGVKARGGVPVVAYSALDIEAAYTAHVKALRELFKAA